MIYSHLFNSIIIPIKPITKHKGEKNFESARPKSVVLIFLKTPTYLKSPIERKIKIDEITHPHLIRWNHMDFKDIWNVK